MAVRKERSRRPAGGVRARSDDRRNGQQRDGFDGGWGTGTDLDQESMFVRRVLFAVLLAVAGSMGIWFLLTTFRGAEQGRSILSVTHAPSGVSATYTVKLMEVAPEKRRAAEAFMNAPVLGQLAGPHGCALLELADGRLALCVGEFEDSDSPQLQELLRRSREFRHGDVSFRDASILSYRE